MTYSDLLAITAEKKRAAIRELNDALKGPAGFLVKAEIKKNPGSVAWHWLAQEFCETLAEHIDELMEAEENDPWGYSEVYDIYTAYEDADPDLYEMLPVEAQLFTK